MKSAYPDSTTTPSSSVVLPQGNMTADGAKTYVKSLCDLPLTYKTELVYEIMYVYRHGGKWFVKSPSIL